MTREQRLRTCGAPLRILLCGIIACGDATPSPPTAPRAPSNGSLAVFVRTTGSDLDIDGYEVVITPGPRRSISSANGSGSWQVVTLPGTYTVQLERVAPNCNVTGTHPLSVTVVAGQNVNVIIEIACLATGVAITTRTNGADRPEAYPLFVNDVHRASVPSTGSLAVTRLPTGSNTVRLSIPDHCSIGGDSRGPVEIRNRELSPVTLDITCVRAVPREKIAYDGEVFSAFAQFPGATSPTRWIFLANPDGSAAMEVTPGHSASWSRDGTRLLFSTTLCTTEYYYGFQCFGGLSILNPDTRAVTPLAGGKMGTDPAWAPSGEEVAFTRCCTKSFSLNDPARLFVARLDGSQEQMLFDGPSSDPSWSPDGRWIAFGCASGQGRLDVCLVMKDGTGLRNLTASGARSTDPAWSPDGARLAFTLVGGVNGQVAVMRIDGTGVTTLADGNSPAWSRDGQKLVFARTDGIYTMNADGSNVMRLVQGLIEAPAWRP